MHYDTVHHYVTVLRRKENSPDPSRTAVITRHGGVYWI